MDELNVHGGFLHFGDSFALSTCGLRKDIMGRGLGVSSGCCCPWGWKDKVEFGEPEVIVKQRENVRLPLGDGMFCLAELLPLDIQFIRVHSWDSHRYYGQASYIPKQGTEVTGSSWGTHEKNPGLLLDVLENQFINPPRLSKPHISLTQPTRSCLTFFFLLRQTSEQRAQIELFRTPC